MHWGYEGSTGPERWADLGYPECRGANQSPIDLANGSGVPLDPLLFQYQAAGFRGQNNGHTVQFTLDGSHTLVAGGKSYALQQVHFHTNSEHTVQGQTYPLEAHLVHKDTEGQLAVVGVLFQTGGKDGGEGLATLFGALPKAGGDQVTGTARVNPLDLLPASPVYYHYKGSLTTPPCSEGVNWFVMQEAVLVPEALINRFRALFSRNHRPPQPLGHRVLFQQLPGSAGDRGRVPGNSH